MENAQHYHWIIQNLRDFFTDKGFIEVPTQTQVTILAACEDPETVVTTHFDGNKWPLPQTGQMRLEEYLLQNPETEGYFCVTTSYRDEPNPISERHHKVFPMFEFETHGDMQDLIDLEFELMEYLGFDSETMEVNYEDLCDEYGVDFIEPEQENKLPDTHSNVVALKNFPKRSHPYWNMKRGEDGLYRKVDLILHGRETIGSAERATNLEQMREDFKTIEKGKYKELLLAEFGEQRVMKEFEEYLDHEFIQRCGGGIGLTRLQQGLINEGILSEENSIK